MDGSIIEHLINVESDANVLLDDAKQEADSRIVKAKAKADAEYARLYEALVTELSADYSATIEENDAKRKKELADFDDGLHNTQENKEKFVLFLDSVLFGK